MTENELCYNIVMPVTCLFQYPYILTAGLFRKGGPKPEQVSTFNSGITVPRLLLSKITPMGLTFWYLFLSLCPRNLLQYD